MRKQARVKGVRAPARPGGEGPTRQRPPSGAGPRPYLARGRPRLLTVSDAGRSALLMVGPLRGPQHLALIHRHHYYHVPVEAIAPSRTAVACIAFFEGAGPFGHPTGRIREYAAVLRVSRVARRDLPGLTWAGRHGPQAPYLRFDLGPIQQLAAPVTNPERLRVVFRFSDLGQLQAARTLRDLGRSPRSPRTPAP